MKPKHIKKLLMSEIETIANASDKYCSNPGRDFSRKRKLSFKKVVESIIGTGSKGLTNELIDIFMPAPGLSKMHFCTLFKKSHFLLDF